MNSIRRNDWILLAMAALMITGACLVAFIFIWPILQPGESQPTTPPQVLATPTSGAQVACSDRWDAIKASGRMVVGVSADYPPFEYYNAQYQIDGFDPALMSLVAQQIGVQVIFQDYAFEGLSTALQLGQIDAAISAISQTAERQALLDFSDVYYYGLDAILANQNSAISSISAIDQMSPYRVGVQSSSVYENLIRSNLVATGKMPAGNLVAYPRIDTAINDLKAGTIDLVMLDQQPANQFVQGGGVKIVGQGLSTQSYAVAVCKGNSTFLREVNRALKDLQASGQVTDLLQKYMNTTSQATPPPPTPTSALPTPVLPTATPAPPPPCLDNMAFVADLNLPDNNMKNPPVLAPGQPFTKGWRIRNNGTCPWTSTYSLSYVQGNVPQAQMGGQRTFIQGMVPPGSTYDMYVNMVAPVVPGTYQGFWQMLSSISFPFGQRIWVGIQVPAQPTATPQITPTPSTSISFSATPTTIIAGQGVTFNWSVQNATAVYFYAQGQPWQNYPVNATGGTVVYPATTTTYELRVVQPNGVVDVKQITIQVNQPAPNIEYFIAEPTQIKAGACVNLTWKTSGGVTQVQLQRNQYVILDNAQFTGSAQDCPDTVGQVIYTLVARNAAGNSVTNQQTVNVEAPPVTNPLVGTNWQLVSYYDGVGAMIAILPGTDVDIKFGAANDIGGSAGCNTYSGSYLISGSSMAITGISSSKKACDTPPGIMEQESAFLSLLSQTQSYNLNGTQLLLYNASGQLLLEFAPAAP